MGNCQISLNQLADFSDSTEYGKKRIIAQQLVPDRFRIPWYQLSKARVKKSIELKGNLDPVYDGIKTLMAKKPTNKRQETDRRVSIEALERFVNMRLPKLLQDIDFMVIKAHKKHFTFAGVDIIVAPEIIVKAFIDGKTVVGGIKIHISKGKPFDLKKSQIVASTVFRYLEEEFSGKGWTVLPKLSFCLDVFGGRIVSANNVDDLIFSEVEKICKEIKDLYNAA